MGGGDTRQAAHPRHGQPTKQHDHPWPERPPSRCMIPCAHTRPSGLPRTHPPCATDGSPVPARPRTPRPALQPTQNEHTTANTCVMFSPTRKDSGQPSQADLCCFEVRLLIVLRTMLLCFNPPSGFVLFRSRNLLELRGYDKSFNPPSGFVLFRSLLATPGEAERSFQSAKRICAVSKVSHCSPTGSPVAFQSAKRICAVSKSLSPSSSRSCIACFNPPSGFVLFRRSVPNIVAPLWISFNPPSGFVLFRSNGFHLQDGKLRFQSAKRICAVSKMTIRRLIMPRYPLHNHWNVR